MQEENLEKKIKEMIKPIKPVARKFLNSYINQDFQEVADYQISTGGKRIRPALAIISCKMLGGKLKDVLYAAAGLEILHNYTLIIDDIIDNSKLRRGMLTTWKKFGCSITNCAVVNYSAAIFQSVNQLKVSEKISEIFIKTMKTITEGEILDILFEQNRRENEPYIKKNHYQKITEKDYFKMVSKKTAILFQSCCEIGGICTGAKQRQIKFLKSYGFNFGIAFQIQDDILDIFGDKKFGKEIGGDIIGRKRANIVIFNALKELSKKNQKKLQAILKKKKILKSDIREGLKLIKKTKSLENSQRIGQRFINEAKRQLDFLPQNEYREMLFYLADFVVKRKK